MNNFLPEVDFIILSMNRVDSTLDTLNVILNQQGITPFIYIVDQRSDPDQYAKLMDYVSGYENMQILKYETNIGVSKGRDVGIRAGTSKYIIELDNDAVLSNEYDSLKVVKLFEKNDRLGAIGFEIDNYVTGKIDPNFWVYPKSLFKEKNLDRFLATRFCGAGHAIKRSAYQETEGYDHSLFFYWEELDLSYQMIRLGYEILFTPEIKVVHKVDPDQRVNWKDKRYYYLVRNALYLQFKYFGFQTNIYLLTLGYFFRGLKNGMLHQFLKGVRDSGKMMKNLKSSKSFRMTNKDKEYIFENDQKYRGGLWNRFIKETFIQMK